MNQMKPNNRYKVYTTIKKNENVNYLFTDQRVVVVAGYYYYIAYKERSPILELLPFGRFVMIYRNDFYKILVYIVSVIVRSLIVYFECLDNLPSLQYIYKSFFMQKI